MARQRVPNLPVVPYSCSYAHGGDDLSDQPAQSPAVARVLTLPSAVLRLVAAALSRGPGALVLVIVGVAFNDGGFTPVSWGWATAVTLGIIASALAVRADVRVPRRILVMLATLGAMVVLDAASGLWAGAGGPGMLEAERTLVYAGAMTAMALTVSASAVNRLLYGLVGTVFLADAYGLWTRLLNVHVPAAAHDAQSRLQAPFGYWNALGIFSAMGTVLAIGMLIAGLPRAHQRALAGALPVMVLALYLTFSRGAIAALVAGLVVVVFSQPRRLRALTLTLVYLALPVVVVLAASRDKAVIRHAPTLHQGLSQHRHAHRLARWLASATSQGRILTGVLVLAVVASVVIAPRVMRAERRIHLSARGRRRYVAALVTAAVLAVVAIVIAAGSPMSVISSGVGALNQAPPRSYRDYNKHLFSTSLDGRNQFWSSAWQDFTSHPLLGSGAGTFDRFWVQHRTVPAQIQEAHSLELETAAELGVVGLALLALLLVPPLVAGFRARSSDPLVPAALGAYVAFLVHATTDWDWEVPAVTLVGLLCGGVLLILSDRHRFHRLGWKARRVALVCVGVAALCALTAWAGNSMVADARASLAGGNPARATELAGRAETLMPWSGAPAQVLGDAALAQGNAAQARADFRRSLASDSGNWAAWYGLAVASSGGQRRDALAHARRLDPFDVQALAAGGRLQPPPP